MISPRKFKLYAAFPELFRRDLFVDVSGAVRRFGDVMDEWQSDDFAELDPALERCCGRSDSNAIMRAYLERPRGHSKTHDLAVMCAWALVFATRSLKGFVFAADRDQAKLLKDAVQTLLRLNPWLASVLEIQKDLVVNVADGHPGAGSTLTISTSDVGSSYGLLADLIVADELTHWQEAAGEALWASLISTAAKRTNCLLVVISNAGFHESWQWNVREAARTDDAWYFSRLDGPQATWMTEERLAEQRRMLPAVAYGRLWLNQWSSGGGDALTEQDVNRAFENDHGPMSGAERGWQYVGGVDLGLTRDCAALCVLGVRKFGLQGQGRIRLAHMRLWKPTLGKKINLSEIERELFDCHERYRLESVAFDSWQAAHMSQRLATYGGLPMMEVPPTGHNLQMIAARLIESFTDHRLQLYECDYLKRDLLRLRLEERSYGYRLVSPRDASGHGDSASAFGLALMVAHDLAGQRPFTAGAICYSQDSSDTYSPSGIEQNSRLRARRLWCAGIHPEDYSDIEIL